MLIWFFFTLKSLMIDNVPKESINDPGIFIEEQEDRPEVKYSSIIN